MNKSKPIFEGMKPFPMFIFTSLGVIVIGFIVQFTVILIGALVFRLPLNDLLNLQELDSAKINNAVKFIQIIG